MAKLITIYWRDIPAQVNAQSGRTKQQVVLDPRFLRSIQRAAKFAGKMDVHEFVREWRRVSRVCSDDLALEAATEARRLEAEFDEQTLRAYIRSGGVTPTSTEESSPDEAAEFED